MFFYHIFCSVGLSFRFIFSWIQGII
jgi:hypothetical protein